MDTPRPTVSTSARRAVWAGCVLLLAGCAGCVTINPEGISLLKSANTAYDSKRWDAAENQAAVFIQKYQNSPEVAGAYYLRGMARFNQREFAQSEEDFKKALDMSKHPELTAKCHTMLGHLAMQKDSQSLQDYSTSAAEHYREAVKGLPEGPAKAEVYWRFGVALRRSGQWDEARLYFARVSDGYPHSPYAQAAKKQLAWSDRWFSIQCGVYRQLNNAMQQKQRLLMAGLPARQLMLPVGGEPQYVVLVGQYPTYRDAKVDLSRVRMTVKDAIVLP